MVALQASTAAMQRVRRSRLRRMQSLSRRRHQHRRRQPLSQKRTEPARSDVTMMPVMDFDIDTLIAAMKADLHVAMQKEPRRSIERAVDRTVGRLTDNIAAVEARTAQNAQQIHEMLFFAPRSRGPLSSTCKRADRIPEFRIPNSHVLRQVPRCLMGVGLDPNVVSVPRQWQGPSKATQDGLDEVGLDGLPSLPVHRRFGPVPYREKHPRPPVQARPTYAYQKSGGRGVDALAVPPQPSHGKSGGFRLMR